MEVHVCWFLPLPAAVLAEALGLYEKHGIVVRTTNVRSSDEQYELLAEGGVDAAITAMDNVLVWNGRGAVNDLRVIAQAERTTGSVLLGGPGINCIERLRGKALLVDSPENGFVIVTRTMLRDRGLAPDEYELAVVGGVKARVEALLNGSGHAALLTYLFEQQILEAGGHALGRVNDFYRSYPGQGLVARQSAPHPARMALTTWLQAIAEAARWAKSNSDQAAAILCERTKLPLSAARNMLSALPSTFRPCAEALALVIAQRANLGLPGAEGGVAALFDPRISEQLSGNN